MPHRWPRDLAGLRNDLEPAALTVCPPVDAVLAALRALPGCLLARMSGSGATCFGLFADSAAGGAGGPVRCRRAGGGARVRWGPEPLYERRLPALFSVWRWGVAKR